MLISQTIVEMSECSTKILKTVSFNDLEIREYPIILGDNPGCSNGVPITIDWVYAEQEPLDIEEYENLRGSRRDLHDMRIPARNRIGLVRHCCTNQEISAAYWAVDKIKRQRHRTIVMLDTPFEVGSCILIKLKIKSMRMLRRLCGKKSD